jgi:hypothetical protein
MLDRLATQHLPFWLGVLGCFVMIVGALGSWATAFGIVSVPGTRGDGWFVVAAAVAGLSALWTYAVQARTWPLIAAVLAGLGGAGVSAYDLHKLRGIGAQSFFGKEVQIVHAGWGIYTSLYASVALGGCGLILLLVRGD